LNIDLAATRLALRRRHRNLQNSVLEGCLHLLCIHPLWQWDLAVESSVATLGVEDPALSLFVLGTTLASDYQGIVGDFHLHVIFCETRQVSAHNELSVTLKHFHRRGKEPAARRSRPRPATACSELLKILVHFLAEAAHQGKRRHAEHVKGVHIKQ
jgi:hypothetical protein